ncbi:MAG: shikimate dehydrogenase [Burkholderiaceae bacterium]|nr:shikimate dehydrogenase [Burkholderiaceae bacterium]
MSTHPPFKLAGVMGWPIAHSRSPSIHNHWIRQYGLNGAYVLLPVDPLNLKDALKGLSALGFAGCNLTIPHKVMALPLVDRVNDTARRMGAVNTIVVEADGTLSGFNTDGFGYIQSLLDAQPDWRADAGPALVMGAGGAARAVIVSLAERGAKDIRVCNRTDRSAQDLAAEFSADFAQSADITQGATVSFVPWAQRHDAVEGVALLVNTTSQGMGSNPALDLDLARLPVTALVSDVVYIPLETPLLAAARARGNPVAGGLGMLLNQARPAFKSWFGVMPEVTPELLQAVKATF